MISEQLRGTMPRMSRSRRTWPVVLLALALLLAAGCDGGDDGGSTTPPGTTTDETSPETMSVAAYLLRDGKVSPVSRSVAASPAVARAALEALLDGPTTEERAAGLASAIPEGTRLLDVSIADDVATVDLSGSFDDGGGSASMLGRVAQVVATLTRFPNVERVAFRLEGDPVEAIGGEGGLVDPPVGRLDVEEQTPQILVESPLPGDTVSGPIRLRGTANVFEATVSLELRDAADEVILETFTTATSGTGTRGTFAAQLEVPEGTEGAVTIVAFEASAEDGRPLHVVRVPVTVER